MSKGMYPVKLHWIRLNDQRCVLPSQAGSYLAELPLGGFGKLRTVKIERVKIPRARS
jgi:hypothetical protein